MDNERLFFEAIRECSPKKAHPRAKELLSDLSWLSLAPSAPTEPVRFGRGAGLVDIGHNVFLQNCESSPLGLKGVADYLSISWRRGLACFARLGKHRFKDAARLFSLLDPSMNRKSVVIRCQAGPDAHSTIIGQDRYLGAVKAEGGSGTAVACTTDTYPLIYLTTEEFKNAKSASFSAENYAATSVGFHEFVHLLGYHHDDSRFSIDVTDLAEMCCFPGEGQKKPAPYMGLKDACDQLKAVHRNVE